jgi:membrane protein YqaA with SNARE-associated domain
MELVALFAVSLLAATIVPAQSEAVLVALHQHGDTNAALLVLVATLGNVLGACINWLLGRYLLTFQQRRWFPIKPAAIQNATRRYQRFGVWSLLFSWLPIIGDPLTLVAGFYALTFCFFLCSSPSAKQRATLRWLRLSNNTAPANGRPSQGRGSG